MTSVFLPAYEYNLPNTLLWGICKAHWARAKTSTGRESLQHRMIAIFESIPLIGQITSLFEWALAHLLTPSYLSLMQRPLCAVKRPVENLPHRDRLLTSKPYDFSIELPSQDDLAGTAMQKVVLAIQRWIDLQYKDLAWPKNVKNVLVGTQIQGGLGDVRAAARVIGLMQSDCPRLNFDWVLLTRIATEKFVDCVARAPSFLTCADPSKVTVRDGTFSLEEDIQPPADFIVVGPMNCWGPDYVAARCSRAVEGASFWFLENGEASRLESRKFERVRENLLAAAAVTPQIHQRLYKWLFEELDAVPMGLAKGTGVFFDDQQPDALVSGYCDLASLLRLQDGSLCQDILQAMGVFDQVTVPDASAYSFNLGYAHNLHSLGNAIECMALDEPSKHMVIVMNSHGEYTSFLTRQEFCQGLFSEERISFLKECGFDTILFKSIEKRPIILRQGSGAGRRLTVICRSSFHPSDMKMLQVAAERMLGTGDNTALEAWQQRCKLFMYEKVACNDSKQRFLQQQIDLARDISPQLSLFLKIFGEATNRSFTQEERRQLKGLLANQALSDTTLQYCDYIRANYAFSAVCVGAIKRRLWTHLHPEKIHELEQEALGTQFYDLFFSYVKQTMDLPIRISFPLLPRLANKLQAVCTE